MDFSLTFSADSPMANLMLSVMGAFSEFERALIRERRIPVLAQGNGRTKTGRLWVYVRDDRRAGSTAAPAAWFAYTPNRQGQHPQAHLANFSGVLQADAFPGYDKIFADGRARDRCSMTLKSGCAHGCSRYRRSRTPRRPSTTCSISGRRWCTTATTGLPRSTGAGVNKKSSIK
jgi:hypothetical protein